VFTFEIHTKFVRESKGETQQSEQEVNRMPKANITITTKSSVKVYETWANGEHDTVRGVKDTNNTWRTPRFRTQLQASCHAHTDNLHSFGLQVSEWLYLEGSLGDSIYSSFDLLNNNNFTLEQLEMISKTLKAYIKGIKTGEISTR